MYRLQRNARAIGIAAFGIGCIWRGFAWSPLVEHGPNKDAGGPTILSSIMPIHVYAGAWAAVGVIAVISAFMPVLQRAACNAVGALWLTWGTAYFFGWMFVTDPAADKDWISFATYFFPGVAILAWTHLSDPLTGPGDE